MAAPAPNPFAEIEAQAAADAAYKADPSNPFARIEKAQALGLELDTSAPVGQPGFLGGVADIGRGLAQGAISTFPKALADTSRFFGVAPETGKYLENFAKEQATAHPEFKQSQVGQIALAEDSLSVRGGAYSGGENLPLSSGTMLAGAAIGAGVGLLGGPVGVMAGAKIGATVGSLAAMPIFYGSQGQQSADTVEAGLIKSGMDPEQAKAQARTAGHLSGTVESGGEFVGNLPYLGALWGKVPFVGPIAGQLVKSVVGGAVKKTAAAVGGILATEIGTEMAQQALEDQIEKQYGSGGPGATWKNTLQVVVPTALMTVIPGGLTAAHTFRTNFQVNKALNAFIEKYARQRPYLKFLDIDDMVLGSDGQPRGELFAADKLHFSAEGYRLLADRVRPLLPK